MPLITAQQLEDVLLALTRSIVYPPATGSADLVCSAVLLGEGVALIEGAALATKVDAGVGGKAAIEVGRRLAALAKHTQVIVVTHLPQVAAWADTHFVVKKSSDGSVSQSDVTKLEDKARVEEIARMLAGLEGSASAQEHAAELLAMRESISK